MRLKPRSVKTCPSEISQLAMRVIAACAEAKRSQCHGT